MADAKDLVTIDRNKTLDYALDLMEKKEVSRLIVAEDNVLLGIITEGDIANALADPRKRKFLNLSKIKVSAAMKKDVITVKEGTGPRDMAKIMLENSISSLVVLNSNNSFGIVTKTDIIKRVSESDVEISLICTKNPLTVSSGETIVHARKLMLENCVHRLLVVDNGLISGIITERDIAKGFETFRKAIDYYTHPDVKMIKVEQFMTKDPVVIKGTAKLKDAVNIMLEKKISGIPVVGNTLWIITKTDIVRGIAEGILSTKI